MRNNLATEIQQQLNDRKFRRLLLAVSGGLDSICLAHYFITNRDVLGVEWLGIAHVNHGLRAGSADLDEKLVCDFAAANGIPFFCAHLDGAALKSAEGSLEENARDARYQALSKIADEIARSPVKPGMTSEKIAILTAHHAGDQAETVYMRLRRGTSLKGLHGMVPLPHDAWSRETNQAALSFPIYRPFLNVPREELCNYARKNNLTWREDESNADTKFTRNLVRQKLLPALEETNAGASEQLCRIATLAEKAHTKITATVETIFSQAIIEKENWPFEASLSPYRKVLALDKQALQKAFDSISKAPSPLQKSGMFELFRLWLDSRGFRFPTGAFSINVTKSSINKPQRGPDECQEPRPHTSYLIPSFSFRTRSIEKCRHIIWIYDTRENQVPSNLYFSNEKQRFSGIPGLWRHPQDGDVLSPLDMKIKARKLATWLQEKSVPHWIRGFLQVYAQESRVLFVSGIRNKKFDI